VQLGAGFLRFLWPSFTSLCQPTAFSSCVWPFPPDFPTGIVYPDTIEAYLPPGLFFPRAGIVPAFVRFGTACALPATRCTFGLSVRRFFPRWLSLKYSPESSSLSEILVHAGFVPSSRYLPPLMLVSGVFQCEAIPVYQPTLFDLNRGYPLLSLLRPP